MLSREALINVRGGGISSTMLNAISRVIDTLLNLGQTVGSAIRRSISNKYCKLN